MAPMGSAHPPPAAPAPRRYADNFDAVNSLVVIEQKTDKKTIEDFGAPEKFLEGLGYLFGKQAFAGEERAAGGGASRMESSRAAGWRRLRGPISTRRDQRRRPAGLSSAGQGPTRPAAALPSPALPRPACSSRQPRQQQLAGGRLVQQSARGAQPCSPGRPAADLTPSPPRAPLSPRRPDPVRGRLRPQQGVCCLPAGHR
jgi:hypothetical protein